MNVNATPAGNGRQSYECAIRINVNSDVVTEVEKMLPETSGNIAVAHAAVIGNNELRQAQGGVPETVVNPAQYNAPQTDDIAAEKAEFYRQATENAQRAKIPPLTSF